MSCRIPLGPVSALSPGASRVIEAEPESIAVFNVEGVFFACSSRCPHAGGPLSDGFLRGTSVVCPWHGWDFDLSVPTNDAMDGVIRYSVTQEDGELFLHIP